MFKKIFIVRHGEPVHESFDDFGLSDNGQKEAFALGWKIASLIDPKNDKVIIWTSPAKRTCETAMRIAVRTNINPGDFSKEELLGIEGLDAPESMRAIKEKINSFEKESDANVLIIVTHQGPVRLLPIFFGFYDTKNVGHAEGYFIHDGTCDFIKADEE